MNKPISHHLRTRPQQNDFEVRRLDQLLLLVEHANSPEERAVAGDAVHRSLRRYLTEFHHLSGRSVSQ